jgi:hypothetical protein
MNRLKEEVKNLIKYLLHTCDNVSNISSSICEENLYVLLSICCFDSENRPKYIKYAIPYDDPNDFDATKHKHFIYTKVLTIG